MKAKEFRNLTDQELIQKEKELRQQLFKLNLERFSGKVEKPHLFKQTRKDIARILHILNEREKQKDGKA
ncbi:MAG: 50S ribosomal protein L29 [Candidatus Omnitrophica bacterium]|nr:50S ribosomal protein L29 [Candidatus Omnitrophota bacterium]